MYLKPSETNYYRKQKERESRLISEQAEMRLNKDANIKLSEETEKEKREQMFSKLSRRHLRESREFELQKFALKDKVLQELLVESFCNVVYDSVMINEDAKVVFKEKIYEDSKTLLNSLMESGSITLDTFGHNSSITVREIYSICEDASDELVDESENTEDLNEKANKISKDKKKKTREDKVSKTVKDKVTEVIRREKQVAEANDEQTNIDLSEGVSYRKNESPSLFRAINIAASAAILESSTDQKIDMDMVFAESLIQYTLLETMNTMNLIKFDPKSVKRLISDYIH